MMEIFGGDKVQKRTCGHGGVTCSQVGSNSSRRFVDARLRWFRILERWLAWLKRTDP